MKHFLLIFDRSQGRVLSKKPYSDRSQALDERFAAERLHRGDPNVEVVVLGADSEDALKRTHARYFRDTSHLYADAVKTVSAAGSTESKAAKGHSAS